MDPYTTTNTIRLKTSKRFHYRVRIAVGGHRRRALDIARGTTEQNVKKRNERTKNFSRDSNPAVSSRGGRIFLSLLRASRPKIGRSVARVSRPSDVTHTCCVIRTSRDPRMTQRWMMLKPCRFSSFTLVVLSLPFFLPFSLTDETAVRLRVRLNIIPLLSLLPLLVALQIPLVTAET